MTGAAAGAVETQSVDRFLGGRVTLIQPRSGHRAGLDAALLQALVPADAKGRAVDLGTGAGTVALALAARVRGLSVVGIERSPDLIACADAALGHRDNAGFADRIRFIEADATARRETRQALGLPDASCDWVVMNPPFDQPGRVRASPDAARRDAHVAAAGSLVEWCRTAAGLLRPGGHLGLIHRTAALPDILGALAGRFGDVRIRPVHPSLDRPATRILMRATRGSRADLKITAGLVLHDADGGWTLTADSILRGDADIAF